MAEKIHILISLFAGVIVAVLSLYCKLDPTFIAARLIIVIAVFYIVGVLFKNQIIKILHAHADSVDEEMGPEV
ncbi:MAG: hypothetical protein LBV08_07940 [Clostridiales bacterium]|nr:hypothetical protein [Clostridiales bacterium]